MNFSKDKRETALVAVFAVAMLIVGVSLHETGVRNFDAGHNMNTMSCQFNTVLVDMGIGLTADGKFTGDPGTWINLGQWQIMIGFAMALAGAALFVFALSRLYYEGYDRWKR